MSDTKEKWVTTTRAERIEILARKVVGSRHDDLDTGSINWVAVLACHVDALADALGEADPTASYSHAAPAAKEHCPRRLMGETLAPHAPCDTGDHSRDAQPATARCHECHSDLSRYTHKPSCTYATAGLTVSVAAPPSPAATKDVHTEHCCTHGCKYGEADCTVVSGKGKQSFPCDECDGYSSTHKSAVDQACEALALARIRLEELERRGKKQGIFAHPAVCFESTKVIRRVQDALAALDAARSKERK